MRTGSTGDEKRPARSDGSAKALAVLRSLAIPVVVVAAGDGDERSCSIATVTYVSLEPPLVAVPFSSSSKTLQLAQRSGELSVAIVPASNAANASLAAHRGAGQDKFAEFGIPVRDDGEAPALDGSIGTLWCSVSETFPLGDHVLIVGRVHHAARGVGGSPLVRHQSRYYELGPEVRVPEGPAYPL